MRIKNLKFLTTKKVRKRMSRLVKRNKRLGVFDVMREIRDDMSRSGDLISNISGKRKHGRGNRESTAMVMMIARRMLKLGPCLTPVGDQIGQKWPNFKKS